MPIALLFILNRAKELIVQERSDKFFAFVERHIKPWIQSGEVLKTNEVFNIRRLPANRDIIVNLELLNNIPDVNLFLNEVNGRLADNGLVICSAETIDQRKKRILRKYPPVFNHLYYGVDFLYKRVLPKFGWTNWIQLKISGGRNQTISRSEMLGRLVYNGFQIVTYEEIDSLLHVTAKKCGPQLARPEPSKGLILRIKRIGKHGKPITVYKLRTMHPYAEFIQSLVYEENKLQQGGKFKNDFRITSWGRFFRKTFIDEIPMIANLIKGDLGIVGVRPLSEHYLSLYPDDVKELRKAFKPGLIPPYYVDLPKSLDEIVGSEVTYLKQRKRAPLRTNLKYFRKAVYNICVKGARSN